MMTGPMTIDELRTRIGSLRDEALSRMAAANDSAAIEAVRSEVLGRSGELTAMLRRLGELPPGSTA
jgi:phenylalanyl-tRNA synthetase alpha chain